MAFGFGVAGILFTHLKLLILRKHYKVLPALEAGLRKASGKQALEIALGKEIRAHHMDIAMFALLIGACEDIPQVILISTVISGTSRWTVIAVRTLAVSILGAGYKLTPVLALAVGLGDPTTAKSNVSQVSAPSIATQDTEEDADLFVSDETDDEEDPETYL